MEESSSESSNSDVPKALLSVTNRIFTEPKDRMIYNELSQQHLARLVKRYEDGKICLNYCIDPYCPGKNK